MRRQWKLTDLEFAVLWRDLREVLLPAPFTYTLRVGSNAEGERRFQHTREHLAAIDFYGLDDTLDVVAKPDLRIILHSWDPRAPDDPETHVRLHAVRRSDRTYLLEQLPGETVRHSGGFTITECGYLEVADLMAARLPERQPGGLSEIVLPRETESLAGFGQSPVRRPHEDAASLATARFRRTPQVRIGAVEVRQGICRHGPKYRARSGFWLLDLEDDGRYIVSSGRPRIATGADSAKVAARINSAVAEVIVSIRDQRL
ncbi:ESX secretion-associated protein EspG [Nocardia paucivorans]|uniref:ESX secretion-associated protein EspG n=1 Tax=Nocardia paucivorans TaxID=114259 RepID=UPI0002F82C18|nr:ESX secretion-associated protein EspG [Nocardia paucivorans]